jgi:hypothetical protein
MLKHTNKQMNITVQQRCRPVLGDAIFTEAAAT